MSVKTVQQFERKEEREKERRYKICRFSQFREHESVSMCIYNIKRINLFFLYFIALNLRYSFPIFLSFRFIDVFLFSLVCPLL